MIISHIFVRSSLGEAGVITIIAVFLIILIEEGWQRYMPVIDQGNISACLFHFWRSWGSIIYVNILC